jgi:hypothetical protein
MLVTSFLFQKLSETSYFHRHVRRFLADYGMPISLIATSGMAYWGRFNLANPTTLPVGGAFRAANGREWLVKFWELDGKWVGIAFPFGVILWILFFFDHNVSVGFNLATSMYSADQLCLVSHRTRIAVPSPEAARFPLRFLPAGYYNLHRGTYWCAGSEWSHTTSAHTYHFTESHGASLQE